jgi:hypothetical protein
MLKCFQSAGVVAGPYLTHLWYRNTVPQWHKLAMEKDYREFYLTRGHMYKYEAEEKVGKLSHPAKMPCPSYSIPAQNCETGAKLVKVKGSVCEGCYALKGMYRFPSTKTAMQRRLGKLESAMAESDAREEYIQAFEVLLSGMPFFRWHDSGDLQGHRHLSILCEIARRCSTTLFWLPTREYGILNTFLETIPDNLMIRKSAHMIDGRPPEGFKYTSTVHSGEVLHGKECRASTRGGHCGECRACWDPKVKNVSYPLH